MSIRLLLHLQVIHLWPNEAPGSEALRFDEVLEERSESPAVQLDRAVTQVRRPQLTAYLPLRANGASVLIAPGGGYQNQAFDKEGSDLAEWLNELGYTAFVLRYRLPAEGHDNGSDVPLQLAQRAVRLIRSNCQDWGLRPDQI